MFRLCIALCDGSIVRAEKAYPRDYIIPHLLAVRATRTQAWLEKA